MGSVHYFNGSCELDGADAHPRKKPLTRIETLAEQHRLKVTRAECGNQVIQGRQGQLYFDGPELCLMVLDGEPANRSKWATLGGYLWLGDISRHPITGKRAQDVKITGIPLSRCVANQ